MTSTTTSTPKVSVMMPAYNEAAVIAEAIDSIVAQTFGDWELIVVDDGSTDATAEIVARRADPRIRLLRQANAGRAVARNEALGACRGEYIAIADADDRSLPERLALQVAFLEDHPEVTVVAAQLDHFAPGLPPTAIFRYPTDPAQIAARFARGAMGVAHPTCMIRRALFDSGLRYEPECRRAQDLELFLRAAPRARFACLPEALVHYRNDPRAMTLGAWMEVAAYGAYAQYRQAARRAQRVPEAFATWRSRPATVGKLWSLGLAQFARYEWLCRRRLAGLGPVIELR